MSAACQPLDARSLRHWPLPVIEPDADKEERGRVLVAGGSREIAGAVQLAAVAALRAGAGKLVIATAASAAANVAQAVPEARVVGIGESPGGALQASGIEALGKTLDGLAAVLVGPGMMDSQGTAPFVLGILDACRDVPVVLDASAMDVVIERRRFDQPVLLTPHAGEMAHLLGIGKDEVERQPEAIARRAASRWNAVVALKGATTVIATPDGSAWRHEGGHPGLATSGSGDVLAGLILGFAARGVALEQAAAWGVVMHALGGRVLARQLGPLGFLAREIAHTVPALLRKWGTPVRRTR
jgi:ADP-dependent NAD(P)H-hydrate dehydratase